MSAGTIWRCWAALMLLLARRPASLSCRSARSTSASRSPSRPPRRWSCCCSSWSCGQQGLVRAFAAAGFFWLLIMIVLTGADYWHRTDARAPIDEIRTKPSRCVFCVCWWTVLLARPRHPGPTPRGFDAFSRLS